MKPRSTNRTAGFTLIEVLVAMMIMAIMAVMAWQGVDGIVRARDASNERLERQLRVNTVLAQWEQDLLSVQDSYLVPALAFDGSTLRLTRRTNTGMQVVAWSMRGNSWMRWASPPVTTSGELQESWLRTQQLLGNETGQLRVLGGMTSWQLYFYRGDAWTNAQSSGDAAQPPPAADLPGNPSSAPVRLISRTLLPAGVRLVMNFAGEGLAGTLTRDIALGPQPR
ncbi:prepilin-type N-terminal cleavage/methylation domain-containing protein [soil metagenome]